MIRKLKYIEGSSNKFWMIETEGNNYTVTYGKIGTTGVTKTKTFANEALCLKEAEKLVAEKLKKGYSESGEVSLSSAPKSPSNIPKQELTKQQVLALYDQLLATHNLDGLLPFLEQHSKGHVTELKKHIKKAKTYWDEYVQEPPKSQRNPLANLFAPVNEFKRRGNETTDAILNLTALAIFNAKEAISWNLNLYLYNYDNPVVSAILQWSNPQWLSDYLLARFTREPWGSLSYHALRRLEKAGIIDYIPELFAPTLASFSNLGLHDARAESDLDFINAFLSDQQAITRDVPLLFVYETTMHSSYIRLIDKQSEQAWPYLFDKILNKGLMSRLDFFERALLTQHNNWNNALKTFIRQLIKQQSITEEEVLRLQDTVISLLRSDQSAVVNYAIELLKPLISNASFKRSAFLNELPAIMMRDDCKASIKTVIIELEKLAKQDSNQHANLCLLVADALVIQQLALQERAAKFIIKYGNTTDVALIEKLQSYQEQLLGNVTSLLDDFIQVSPTPKLAATSVEPIHYQYQQPNTQKLQADKLITLPTSWDDILYLFGRFIQSADPIEFDLINYSLISCRQLFPNDADQQLKPYIKQLNNIQTSSIKHYQGRGFAALLENPAEEIKYDHLVDQTIKDRIAYTRQCILKSYSLTPLSLPTHQPYWVDPEVLVARLIAYENQQQPIDNLDLSIALSRTPRENTAKALALTSQLSDELALLMRFCLEDNVALLEQRQQQKLLDRLFNSKQAYQAEVIWANAARTFYPDQTFNEFKALSKTPFGVEPWHPNFSYEKVKLECPNANWTELEQFFGSLEQANQDIETVTELRSMLGDVYEHGFEVEKLFFELPKQGKYAPNFLYNLGYNKEFYQPENYYDIVNPSDIDYFLSLVPQYHESLAVLIMKYNAKNADCNSASIAEFMMACLDSSCHYRNNALWVLACGILKKKKEHRLLATEVVIKSIAEQRLPLAKLTEHLVMLTQKGYAPFSRVIEILLPLKDISPLHNVALRQWLELIFQETAKYQSLPNQFKKCLELYYDLLIRLQTAPTEDALSYLKAWQDNKSLASLIKKICQLKG